MITRDEALQKFKDILGNKPAWLLLKLSQFINHLSIFQSWALRDALFKVERAEQEFFLSTSINDASVLAHTEDREYVPRKAVPAEGTITVTNQGLQAVTILSGQNIISNRQNLYALSGTVVIDPDEAVDVDIKQVHTETIVETVTEEKAFYEILFDQETSAKIHDLSVSIDTGAGDELWTLARGLRNVLSDDKVYDEFFAHTNQNGVRFGNGIWGMIPPLGATITVTLELADGDIYLAEAQRLAEVGQINDHDANPATLKIVSKTPIMGGLPREGGAELRENLHYWPLYNQDLVWQEDYRFYIKSKLPEILWINIWGETEAEAAYGHRYEHINSIYVSAYRAVDQETLGADILAEFALLKLYNRKVVWVDPLLTPFTLNVAGKVPRSLAYNEVISHIRAILTTYYGQDSTERKTDIFLNDFYSYVEATGDFKNVNSWFTVECPDPIEAPGLNEMYYFDAANSTYDIGYL
jgi:hypothetical protein